MRQFSITRNLRVSLVVFVFSATCAWAQTGTTSLRGTVTDPGGASGPGATVTVTSASIGVTLTTKTDRDGVYQFLEMRPATYELTITADGFGTVRQHDLQLLVATPATNNIVLRVASMTTAVEVSAAALTLNTTDATIGNAIGQTQIYALPFEGRDPTSILSLQPGVVTVAGRGVVNADDDSRQGAVNGARSDQTNITLDGIDNNDQTRGYAFQGALRATLDSIEEFRVTTTNAGADQGRSSGAQVQLVTKSGTNDFHGTAYEYYRPKGLVANEYFNKHSELKNGEPNTPPNLLRNTFGGSFGGPVKKDRMFFFLAYEGQRTRESAQVTRNVPSSALRNGIIQYDCRHKPDGSEDTTLCPGNTVTGLDGSSFTAQPGHQALGPSQIAQMNPKYSTSSCAPGAAAACGPGVDLNSIATMQMYPIPNTDQVGDGFNFRGYTFSAPTPNKLDTYVARLDYNLSGTQRLFARLGLQNDHSSGSPQFPGQSPREVDTNNSKGIIAGYSWTISPTKVNSLHYGFVRQGVGQNGASTAQFVYLRGLDPIVADTRTTSVIVPVHNVSDDFSWTHGRHTFQFGGNWRFVNNIRNSDAVSFSFGLTNAGFLIPTGFANNGTSFDPGAQAAGCLPVNCPWVFPSVDTSFQNAYNFPMTSLAGLITEVNATYIRNSAGTTLPSGSFVPRQFRDNELEFYTQDSYRIKSNLTLTYGLRYSLLQPVYEVHGQQIAPNISLNDFFNTRKQDMLQGISFTPNFSFGLAGPANGKPSYWNWDYKNLAPRLALAWSPGYKEGFLGSLFGGPGKSSIRLGAGIYYDHFGQGIANTFDRNGSFGFVTSITDPPGTVTADSGTNNAPRYTAIDQIPASITPPGPTGKFPVTPPLSTQPGGFAIYWGLDDKLKTPYSYGFDLAYSRELKGGFIFEAAYVGRLGRRLLQERDLAQPINLYDPKTKIGYFQALTALAQIYRQRVPIEQFAANPGVSPQVAQYWADILQPLQAGGAYTVFSSPCTDPGSPSSTTSPLVAAYSLFCTGSFNETTPLSSWDLAGIPDANLSNVTYFPINGPTSFFQSQFASLYAWSSIGRSNYNSGQFSLRHRATHGLTLDFNYTYSKSIDLGSNAERVSLFEGFGYASQIINPFDPGQNRAVSDYDATHQFNTNWVYEFPLGRGKKWGPNWNRGIDAILGGWSFSGLARWTSGLPFTVGNGFDFPTNWELTGSAVQIGPQPKTGRFTDVDGDPNAFASSSLPGGINTLLSNSFRFPFPGESGERNNFRGPGYFDIDSAMRKTWHFTERHSLAFSAEVFNLTNSVRFGFDAAQALSAIDTAGSFGKYNQSLVKARTFEFALRYIF